MGGGFVGETGAGRLGAAASRIGAAALFMRVEPPLRRLGSRFPGQGVLGLPNPDLLQSPLVTFARVPF